MNKPSLGIENLLSTIRPGNKRWGLVTNDAAMTSDLVPVRVALLAAGFQLVRLFSPEHGIGARGADGHAMPSTRDPLTGLPVISLYGEILQPQAADLADLDAIIFDLPDVGVRFYTYIWTLSYIMEACAASGVPLLVLDRPNPLSGKLALVEGPMLDELTMASFIGRWSMPIRHSLTIGELALLWQATRSLGDGIKIKRLSALDLTVIPITALDLTVIPITAWRRDQFLQNLPLPFVPPSPAIASIETLLTYPALCFLEGLNVSEGRGTAFPFRVCGAPWIVGSALAHAYNELEITGVKARPFEFTPLEGTYQQQACGGIMLHVTDPSNFRPVQAGLSLVAVLKLSYPLQLQWANYPTLVNKTGAQHFDRLAGSAAVRNYLEEDPQAFLSLIPTLTQTQRWLHLVEPFLLYG